MAKEQGQEINLNRVLSPNPRLQRTPSAAPPSPRSRKPLGADRSLVCSRWKSISMKSWPVLVGFLGAASPAASSRDQVEIRSGTSVEFGDAATCARVLASRDTFVQAMSPFDRSARLKTDREVSKTEYLAFVARQARDWTSSEKARVR